MEKGQHLAGRDGQVVAVSGGLVEHLDLVACPQSQNVIIGTADEEVRYSRISRERCLNERRLIVGRIASTVGGRSHVDDDCWGNTVLERFEKVSGVRGAGDYHRVTRLNHKMANAQVFPEKNSYNLICGLMAS